MAAPLVHAGLLHSSSGSAEYSITVVDPEPVEIGRVTAWVGDPDLPYTVTGSADARAAALLVVGQILRQRQATGCWPSGVTQAG